MCTSKYMIRRFTVQVFMCSADNIINVIKQYNIISFLVRAAVVRCKYTDRSTLLNGMLPYRNSHPYFYPPLRN